MSDSPRFFGKYFHVLDRETGKVQRQGKVIRALGGGWMKVRWMSFLTGDFTTSEEIHSGFMVDDKRFRFYDFAFEMRDAFDAEQRASKLKKSENAVANSDNLTGGNARETSEIDIVKTSEAC